MIKLIDLTFAYPGRNPVLNNVFLTIRSGAHVALMGPGGSGKTTLALLLKGLLHPSSGKVSVDGIVNEDENSRFEIMRRVGLVFQNPDNTIVATTVERELAFGLENTGIPPDEMSSRVDEALELFDLERYRFTNPANLSGGEKQRCALAAVMVMRPAYLILDEPTSLLDPSSRDSLIKYVHDTAGGSAAIIHITQYVEEAAQADRVIVLGESGIVEDGVPGDVLAETGRFRTCGFHKPREKQGDTLQKGDDRDAYTHKTTHAIIRLDNVIYSYDRGTPYEKMALNDISLSIPAGSSTALLGPTGSGKTTLLEIIAGVTMQTGGAVHVENSPLRAMAFQFPEDQMFGETVASYVRFGPHNIGIGEPELSGLVYSTLDAVGLEASQYRDRDPLTLSGGEKRRTALAGVLAMKPDILVLDEPAAGLDREGMELVLDFLRDYLDEGGTLIFSTHDFDAVWRIAEYAAVLSEGCLEAYGSVEEVFRKSEWLKGIVKCEV